MAKYFINDSESQRILPLCVKICDAYNVEYEGKTGKLKNVYKFEVTLPVHIVKGFTN